jgi:hypothetical protein
MGVGPTRNEFLVYHRLPCGNGFADRFQRNCIFHARAPAHPPCKVHLVT